MKLFAIFLILACITPASGLPTDPASIDTVEKLLAASDLRHGQVFAQFERRIDDRFASQDRAVQTALAAADKRLDSFNEFRGQLRDQAATLMPRAEADARLTLISERIERLQTRLDKSEGQGSGRESLWAFAVGAVGLVAALYVIFRDQRRAQPEKSR